jgi:hypothetical protein
MTVLDPIGVHSGATMCPIERLESFRGSVASYFEPRTGGLRAPFLVIAMPGVSQEGRPALIQHFERELNRLWVLPAHWDGRHAAQLTFAAAQGAVTMLASLVTFESPPPQFFPLPDGGVQVEWLIAGNSIEIEVEADGAVHVLAMNAAGDVVSEGEPAFLEAAEVVPTVRRFLGELTAIWRSGARMAV